MTGWRIASLDGNEVLCTECDGVIHDLTDGDVTVAQLDDILLRHMEDVGHGPATTLGP